MIKSFSGKTVGWIHVILQTNDSTTNNFLIIFHKFSDKHLLRTNEREEMKRVRSAGRDLFKIRKQSNIDNVLNLFKAKNKGIKTTLFESVLLYLL